jgi:hypothetical protein
MACERSLDGCGRCEKIAGESERSRILRSELEDQ